MRLVWVRSPKKCTHTDLPSNKNVPILTSLSWTLSVFVIFSAFAMEMEMEGDLILVCIFLTKKWYPVSVNGWYPVCQKRTHTDLPATKTYLYSDDTLSANIGSVSIEQKNDKNPPETVELFI